MEFDRLLPFATTAEVTTARGYLRACVEQNPHWEPEDSEEIEALTHEQVIARTLRIWPHGWEAFRSYYADDIRAAGEAESAAWFAEATQAARGHLFASRLPKAALRWGRCSLTATEAVTTLGADLAEIRRDAAEWHWIAEILGVPVPVAMAWAVEGRARQLAAVIVRPFRAGQASK
ncbi:hypothetical protein IU459_29475 [Nocardia amamiensis]|uniref:Transcriptional regulator n=1 Tax=Nocardia amamiensis TaxID=404578 RepID=A0ABS0CYG1_9NOCA|nr:hypothetical protein [Nocardia amamiensis]MBF6301639.1 hypothetical protein [Nocardia amamiensis]